MPLNSNRWNQIRYTFYTPIYDLLVGRIFRNSRRRSVEVLGLKPGEKVLLVGAGTGLDLDFLPKETKIHAGDITPSMVQKIRQRANKLGLEVNAEVMDGQNLSYPAESFDKLILHLIVAVIPDPVKCLQEAERVLKPGGEAMIFDKFRQQHQKASKARLFFNRFTSFFFSDINRVAEDLLAQTNLEILENQPANFNGNFRLIRVQKPG